MIVVGGVAGQGRGRGVDVDAVVAVADGAIADHQGSGRSVVDQDPVGEVAVEQVARDDSVPGSGRPSSPGHKDGRATPADEAVARLYLPVPVDVRAEVNTAVAVFETQGPVVTEALRRLDRANTVAWKAVNLVEVTDEEWQLVKRTIGIERGWNTAYRLVSTLDLPGQDHPAS